MIKAASFGTTYSKRGPLFMQLSRKGKILVVSYVIAAFAVTGGFWLQADRQAAAYRRLLDNSYRHAFSELATAVEELDTALQKGVYATSPAMAVTLCTDIFGKAMAAQMAVGELPYGNLELEQTAAFIAKTGDYALALSRNAAGNGGYSQEERQTLLSLSASASALSRLMRQLQEELYMGTATLEDLETVQARLSAATEEGDLPAGGAFQTIEADFPEIPTLIYDGPFSEHIAGRTPRLLEGLGQVDAGIAKRAAADFLGLDTQKLDLVSSGEGSLPTYGFSAQIDGGDLYIEVSQVGGRPVEFLSSRIPDEPALSAQEATEKAEEFLAAHGYHGMAPTYSMAQGGALTVNFAAVQGDVVCYPDLIKVEVALDNGEIMGFEATGYLMNHHTRGLEAPGVTGEAARSAVPDDLTVLSHGLAVIPTGGENEVYCHEFKCETGDGRHMLIYVNAQTGQQEKILLLLEDESGTLTI